jgi:hypothetical protein
MTQVCIVDDKVVIKMGRSCDSPPDPGILYIGSAGRRSEEPMTRSGVSMMERIQLFIPSRANQNHL